MNALEHLRRLILPPPNPLFRDALTIVSADSHVRRLGLYPLITSESLYPALCAMHCGMDYAFRAWGEAAIPAQLVFANEVDRGSGAWDRSACFIGVRAPATPILYITNAFLANLIAAHVLGDRASWHHLPDGMTLPALHTLALIMIEECIHACQLRRGMRPQKTSTIDRPDDPMEEEVRRMMPDILRTLVFDLTLPPYPLPKGTP